MKCEKLGLIILLFQLFPAFASAAKNPSDFTLRVEILSDNVHIYNPSFLGNLPYFAYSVNGRGNVAEGSTLHAFYFRYESDMRVPLTFRKVSYLAKWKKPQQELELLFPKCGKQAKDVTIDLQTDVLDGVYVRTRQGLFQLSQHDYQARLARGEPDNDAPPSPQPVMASIVTITSNPAGAEIDVDGDFLGTTPSVLRLNTGEYTVALRKAGFQPWERKMKVLRGSIHLHEDLVPATPNPPGGGSVRTTGETR